MATINTNDLRVRNAKNLTDMVAEGDCYVFISKPTEWESGDETPPAPNNTVNEFYRTYDQMLSLKSIASTEVHNMVRRLNWVSGVTYDMYDNLVTDTNRSTNGATNPYDALYVVLNSAFEVYACLSNGGGVGSTVEPRSSSDSPFYTSDNYQWMRLYTLTPDQSTNYVTDNFIPITTNDLVSRPDGEIASAVVTNAGQNYTGSPSGVTNQLPYYYSRITGDGDNAVARIQVTSGSVTEVRIVRGGTGYTYAELNFVDGNAYASIGDLDQSINPLNPLGDGTFESRVILPPVGGWGTDLIREIGGTRVGIFSSLLFNQTDFFSGVTFRRLGILHTPTFTQEVLPTTATGCYSVKVNTVGGVESYNIGETITQIVEVDGVNRNALGEVIAYDSENGVIRYFQDPSKHLDTDGKLYSFSGSEFISGVTSEKITQPDTDYSGDLVETTFVSGYAAPEANKYSGTLVYLANISPVLRADTQSEKISLIISY